jgi:4a-hydroxytetrahydrobiopterin dehydratase
MNERLVSLMGLRDPLTPDEVAKRLSQFQGWTGDTTRIQKIFRIDYFDSIKAISELAVAAKDLAHHPDIDLRWQALLVSMTTYSAGGVVTELDFKLVERVEDVLSAYGECASTESA